MPAEVLVRTAEEHVFLSLLDNTKVVTATPFLNWKEHGQRKEIPVHIGVACFLTNCTFDEDDVASGAFANTSPLIFNLQASAWARVLTAATDLGIFDSEVADEHQLLSLFSQASLPQHDMTITHADLLLGEAFDSDPDATAARRGQRGGTPSLVEQVQQGPQDLRFLAMTRVDHLVSEDTLNLAPLARLIGVMGHCLTRKVRDNEMSGVRIAAAILRQGIQLFLGACSGTGFDNPVLAASTCEFLNTVVLHPRMKSKGLSESNLRAELIDAIKYATPLC